VTACAILASASTSVARRRSRRSTGAVFAVVWEVIRSQLHPQKASLLALLPSYHSHRWIAVQDYHVRANNATIRSRALLARQVFHLADLIGTVSKPIRRAKHAPRKPQEAMPTANVQLFEPPRFKLDNYGVSFFIIFLLSRGRGLRDRRRARGWASGPTGQAAPSLPRSPAARFPSLLEKSA
jgi:hypothetical protein